MTESAERMRIAAEFRFARPDVTWDEVAAAAGVTRQTVYRWRNSEAWEVITREVAAGRVSDLVPEAVAALRRAWAKGNPAGALEVLRSFGHLRPTELNVTTESRVTDEDCTAIDRILAMRHELDAYQCGDVPIKPAYGDVPIKPA